MGPVADRTILSRPTPVYPEWAKSEGVEGSVTLYFVVRPDGTVKENVLVQKTAGFEDFDDSARTALRAWRFEALRGGGAGEQWGTITFHFRLRDAGEPERGTTMPIHPGRLSLAAAPAPSSLARITALPRAPGARRAATPPR